jgi:hypothetical protein
MSNLDHRELLIRSQEALLGLVTENLTGVEVGTIENTIIVVFYYLTQPSETEVELSQDIASYIEASLDDAKAYEIRYIVSEMPLQRTNESNHWVFLRYQDAGT